MIKSLSLFSLAIAIYISTCDAFGTVQTQHLNKLSFTYTTSSSAKSSFRLYMSDEGGSGGGGGNMERSKSKKRGVQTITIDKVKTEEKEDIKDESEWRVLLHNDEVHTFEYVVASLVKVIGTIDRKQAWDMCVLTHGNGKATVTKAWKDQAEKYCLGLQRQGLTASIAPDDNFRGKGMDGDLGGPGKES